MCDVAGLGPVNLPDQPWPVEAGCIPNICAQVAPETLTPEVVECNLYAAAVAELLCAAALPIVSSSFDERFLARVTLS